MNKTALFVTGIRYNQSSSPDLFAFLLTPEGKEWLDSPVGQQFIADMPDHLRAELTQVAPPPDQVAALRASRRVLSLPDRADRVRQFLANQPRPVADPTPMVHAAAQHQDVPSPPDQIAAIRATRGAK
jgi:hypothetical protein